MKGKISKKSLYIGAVILLNISLILVFASPFLSFAKHKEIYVNAKASGSEEGTASKPYKTISKAIKKAKEGDKIFVAKGKYKENIVLDNDIKIFGSDRDDVIIEADDRDRPVVTMDDDTEINKVTIREGRIGVEVRKDDEHVSIINCIIEDNSRDGIRIEKGSTSSSKGVSITDNVIRKSGWSGIYSQRRRVVIMNNEITESKKDGIELEPGTSAWIEGNRINHNRGVGMKLYLDGSNIWTKKNTIRNNGKNGIEVKAVGNPGRIDISKSKIYENKSYGIARVQMVGMSGSIWNGLTFSNMNEIHDNLAGNVSHYIRVY